MAYDYVERLYDFRPNDFATFRRGSATLTELPISRSGVGGFFFRLIGGGFHRGGVGVAGVRPDLKAETFFSPLYCIAAVFAKNLDFLLCLLLTSKRKYAILYLPKCSKCKLTTDSPTGQKRRTR